MNSGAALPENRLSDARLWSVGALLLLASAINYMDRQTLANAAVRIQTEFRMSDEQYGNLEAGFGWAFAAGSLFFGIVADKASLRWLYAAVVLLWSTVGFATGLAEGYGQLLVCRTLLGFFEAGHWPCGIKTVRALLDAKGRAMGNSVLQSGTSIGAIATPLIMSWMMTDELGSWRTPFQAIGAAGLLWVVAWIVLAPPAALAAGSPSERDASSRWWTIFYDRRMLIILAVVALINTTWQLLRAWLPKFVEQGRSYTEGETLYFSSLWYVATDVGCLGAGAAVLWLSRRGQPVVRARLLAFLGCALMCLGAVALPWLPQGWPLLGVLLVVGAGALGVFPIYHAFTQDISHSHQGKITGIAGIAAWAFSPLAHQALGRHVDRTKSFDDGLAIAGCLPMIALLLLAVFWPRSTNTGDER
jgi:MFS family permease